MSFDNGTWPLATTLLLSSVAAVLSFLGVVSGLFATLTAKDPLPKRIRGLMRRVPASAEDFRVRGMSLLLSGVGVMLLVSLGATNVLGMAGSGWTGYAPAYAPVSEVAFPKDVLFLITVAVALTAVVCFIGAYSLGIRVHYASTRESTDSQPGLPPV